MSMGNADRQSHRLPWTLRMERRPVKLSAMHCLKSIRLWLTIVLNAVTLATYTSLTHLLDHSHLDP